MTSASDARVAPLPGVRGFIGHVTYGLFAIVAAVLAATMSFDGYILNILMQATTYAVAVFGLSVVLGLCGQINLAQAGFFGLGAYAVGLGTTDYGMSYWICLALGMVISLGAGAVLGMTTLRLGGHYLAMVTISFQQILTLVMINAISLTHGPDGVRQIARPVLFAGQQSYLAFCVVMLAIVGWLVWHLPDTRIGRAMRAVRDNELAASVAGVDVYRTKVTAFAICALLGGLGGGLVRGRLFLCQPRPVLLRRVDRLFDYGPARWRRLADRIGDRYGPPDPDPRMAALPEEHSRSLSGDLWVLRDPHHGLHARRHLGLHLQVRSSAPSRCRLPPASLISCRRRRAGPRSSRSGTCQSISAA